MKITEVRIKLMEEPGERLKAFCSITFDDCFVIRDLKIIDGASGYFVAMPSRKLTSHCPVCHYKNPIRAAYCNQCGARLPMQMPTRDEDGRAKLYADIAHPINSVAREMIQREVIAAYEEEKIRAQSPGYVSRYEELDMMDYDEEERMMESRDSRMPMDMQGNYPPSYASGRDVYPPREQFQPSRDPYQAPAREAYQSNREQYQAPARAISAQNTQSSLEPQENQPRGFGAGIFD
ncbi:MAG: SpoVG family protein [Planctomycetia bacterium]|nr:SpoVG family protein [Planctomycetia bacterium]